MRFAQSQDAKVFGADDPLPVGWGELSAEANGRRLELLVLLSKLCPLEPEEAAS
jgi:hypothetical protein